MDLSPYIESVRAGVANASSLADEQTQHIAERLGTAVESSTRLALIQALSDATGTISAELAPSSVELRMVGMDPEFVVTLQSGEAEPTLLMPEPGGDREGTEEPSPTEADDEPVARITLRLPQSVKARVDEMASSEGISTNAWLIRAVMDALSERSWLPTGVAAAAAAPDAAPAKRDLRRERPVRTARRLRSRPGGVFGERPMKPGHGEPRSRGNVQGWVR